MWKEKRLFKGRKNKKMRVLKVEKLDLFIANFDLNVLLGKDETG